MAWDHKGDECPLAAVDRRLEDVHQLWHQAENAYFEPDVFRVAIQSAIQTARTVTFVLQKNRRAIPDFDGWYGSWQARLSVSPLMKWMVDARNRIEKQGDLEVNSFVRAEIVASYMDEGPSVQVPAGLFDAPRALVESIPKGELGEHIRKDGVLRICRRWIDNSLPEFELLDAVADAYGQLSRIVHAAHVQAGLCKPITTDVSEDEASAEGGRVGRLPCMIGHEEARTLHIWLATGEPLALEKAVCRVDSESAPDLKACYDVEPSEAFAASGLAEDHVRALFAAARKIFLADGFHVTLAFLLRDGTPVSLCELRPEEHGHKYIMMRNLAGEACRLGADAVILIGESWSASADPAKPYMRAEDSPERAELLMATLVSSAGAPLQLTAEVLREGEKVSLGETHESAGGSHYVFAPFYQMWGREIPEDW